MFYFFCVRFCSFYFFLCVFFNVLCCLSCFDLDYDFCLSFVFLLLFCCLLFCFIIFSFWFFPFLSFSFMFCIFHFLFVLFFYLLSFLSFKKGCDPWSTADTWGATFVNNVFLQCHGTALKRRSLCEKVWSHSMYRWQQVFCIKKCVLCGERKVQTLKERTVVLQLECWNINIYI